VIKRKDRQNVDGFNQNTLTQMYTNKENEKVDGQLPAELTKGALQQGITNGNDDESSVGTLFGDESCDDIRVIRYENGNGPLWQACRQSPYVSQGLDDLCELIADFDKGNKACALVGSTSCADRT
jgi:hypothetical protein